MHLCYLKHHEYVQLATILITIILILFPSSVSSYIFMIIIPCTRYIWRTISLANRDVMHIGEHFNLAKRVTLSVHCFVTLHNTCDYKQYWRTLNLAIEAKIAKLKLPPNVPCIRYIIMQLRNQYEMVTYKCITGCVYITIHVPVYAWMQ